MGVPCARSTRSVTYMARQKLAGREKFPLIVELEPLFACNLACNGCGKIQHPTEVLRQRVSVDGSGGGHRGVPLPRWSPSPVATAAASRDRRHDDGAPRRISFVYLCTNGLLLERKLNRFEPHSRFSWVVHIDGLKERHDESVSRDGTFEKAIQAIKTAQARGFKVTTNTTFFTTDLPETVRRSSSYLNDDLQVDQMMISPATSTRRLLTEVHFLNTSWPRTSCSPMRYSRDGRRKQLEPGNHKPGRSSISWRGRSTIQYTLRAS